MTSGENDLYALAGFSKFDAVPAFVKTEVGRRFVVNSACYKFLALLFTVIKVIGSKRTTVKMGLLH